MFQFGKSPPTSAAQRTVIDTGHLAFVQESRSVDEEVDFAGIAVKGDRTP